MNEERLNNRDFHTLKQIGIEQIKKDTKLDGLRISDILEKRFEKFDYVRAKGFINILEKEYNLDLSDWLEEYRSSNPSEENESQEQEAREEYCRKIKQKRYVFLTLGIICLLVAVFAIAVFFNSNTKEATGTKLPTQSEMLSQEPQESNLANQISQEETKQDTKPQNEVKESELKTQENNKENNLPQEEEKQKQPVKPKIDKPIYELGQALFEEAEIVPDSMLYLTFERPIWVGIVELESKKRIAQTQETYEIFLDKDLLIYIAYGNLLISVDENEKKITGYEPLFLIYTKNGGLRRLTQDEYLFANGGVKW